MSFNSIAKVSDKPIEQRVTNRYPKEKLVIEYIGAITPAAAHATARLVKNSEKTVPTS